MWCGVVFFLHLWVGLAGESVMWCVVGGCSCLISSSLYRQGGPAWGGKWEVGSALQKGVSNPLSVGLPN
jgi:hypothetical protein